MRLLPILRALGLLLALACLTFVFVLLMFMQSSVPVDPALPIEEVRLLRRENRPVQAIYRAETLALDYGWTPELLRLTGDLWQEVDDLPRAVTFWEATARLEPNNPPLLRALGQAYIELQRWPEAVDALERLITLTPDDEFAHLRLALIQAPFNPQSAEDHLRIVLREPTYNEIAQPLLEVVTHDPADPLISMRVGLALIDLGMWSYAELAFDHAATIAAPYPEALAYMSFVRDNQGKDGGDFMARAIALEPNNPRIRYLQGLHYRRQGDDTASLYVLMLALALDPENPAYYAELGTGYRLAGDLQTAEYWLKNAVAFSDEDPRFQEMLALFYSEEADSLTVEGFQALDQLAAELPDDPDVQAGRGWALYKLGETEAALDAINAALETDPANLRALFYKGRILLDQDDEVTALPLLQHVAQSDSTFAQEAQGILTSRGS
jgi:tetratricopeptide (TPR) repeat protein